MIAVTGTTGRVGRALADHFSRAQPVIELERSAFDLSDPSVVGRITDLDFEILLLPAAITSLEACEDAPALAETVNHHVPAELARRCSDQGRKVIFFSTDYVLDGTWEGLHDEDAAVLPRSVYARTKADAEGEILASGGCVVRVSWVFGPEKPAFPEMIVDRALAGQPLAAIADKTSLPCLTTDLCQWVAALIDAGCPSQIFHACNGGDPCSWHEMAVATVDYLVGKGLLDARPAIVEQRLSEASFFRGARPRHTAMATRRLSELLGRPPRDWRSALTSHLDTLPICR